MGSGKRASMREGPLAALFRKTETEGLEGTPPPEQREQQPQQPARQEPEACQPPPGFEGSPGIVRISPSSGYRNPAPTEARMSRMSTRKPRGAPLRAASVLKERWVFAMHSGKSAKPSLVNCSILASASGE